MRRRNELLRQRRAFAKEELLHLLDQELLRLRGPGLQAVLVQQHLLPVHPLAPRRLRDVLVRSSGRTRSRTEALPGPPSPSCCERKTPCVPSVMLLAHCIGSARRSTGWPSLPNDLSNSDLSVSFLRTISLNALLSAFPNCRQSPISSLHKEPSCPIQTRRSV